MRRSHLDDAHNPTRWTTPFELVKARKEANPTRKYLTPLPPLAQRLLQQLPMPADGNGRLFPSLRMSTTRGGQPIYHGDRLATSLIARGAPKDFTFHAARHTVATWLENQGYSEWERGLVLNHAHASVTAGYSHGVAIDPKLKALTAWADHVEGLLPPEHPDRLPVAANVVAFAGGAQ
jgi:integrase